MKEIFTLGIDKIYFKEGKAVCCHYQGDILGINEATEVITFLASYKNYKKGICKKLDNTYFCEVEVPTFYA